MPFCWRGLGGYNTLIYFPFFFPFYLCLTLDDPCQQRVMSQHLKQNKISTFFSQVDTIIFTY